MKIPAEKLGEDWFQLCQRILRDRISKVPDSLIVSLLKLMEDNSEEHKVLTNEVMSAAVRAAEKELSKVWNVCKHFSLCTSLCSIVM